jgi:hypothetical protein
MFLVASVLGSASPSCPGMASRLHMLRDDDVKRERRIPTG